MSFHKELKGITVWNYGAQFTDCTNLSSFFVGQVMKAMVGKANPKVVDERLRKALG